MKYNFLFIYLCMPSDIFWVITLLIKRLKEQAPNASQVWFADDSSAAGRLRALKVWWQHLAILGPEFRYFPNASKATMVV